ncbi:hypothetical protein BDV19DRAFT_390973 [Aspergillus venezuelensis]
MSATVTKEGEVFAVVKAFDDKAHAEYKYARYLPIYDNETTFPPTEPFEFTDRGLLADKAKPHLFETGDPKFGSKIHGLQLSQLMDVQKDELALLIAERGVVIFRDQDFKDIGPHKQKEFAAYFGRLHVHPVGAHVEGHIEFHNIYLGADNHYRLQQRSSKLSTTGVPSTGGDTGWVSQVAAYKRLSAPIQKMLEGLRAEHSGFPQAERARLDGKHVTGKKALFVNPGSTKRIVGLKDEESDAILQLIFKHIALSQDIQVRVKWDDRNVSLWDNRVTAHTAISDYDTTSDGLRYGIKLTTLEERPVGVDGLNLFGSFYS